MSLSHAGGRGINLNVLSKERILDYFTQSLMDWLALPEVGLATVFLMGLLASTILPVGSEPVLLAFVAARPDAVWQAIGWATLGNSLGGVVTYWMGAGARRLVRDERAQQGRWALRAEALAQRYGAPVLLLAWLPLVGDPLCAVAGWMRLSFWQCLIYMVCGKLVRYILICGAFWHFYLPR